MADFSPWRQELTQFQTRLAPLETLDQVLPDLVQNLSLGRARIAIDQLQGALESNSLDRIVFATASQSSSLESPSAAAIAVQQFDSGSSRACDMATIIHAGLLKPTSPQDAGVIIQALSVAIDGELKSRGARFLQWATDDCDMSEDSVSHWCDGFGFQAIGTLDYLSGPAVLTADSPLAASETHGLRFEGVNWNRSGELQRFSNLIERTYAHTLDCPQLAAFRTAAQTISGYQASSAFDPDSWFTVFDDRDEPVGCMVLARHQSSSRSDNELAPVIIEIVYMGLVPESRGTGKGKILVQRAFQAAREIGADRIILAVDQQNKPARAIYQLAGLQPMLRERVWVKSLSRAN